MNCVELVSVLQILSPVKVLECANTTTRTRLIPSRFGERFLHVRVFGCQSKHHLRRGTIVPQQLDQVERFDGQCITTVKACMREPVNV